MDTPQARAERLRRAMGTNTQAWLAERVGVAASSINGYLKGKVPPADVCMHICDELAVDMRWYLTGEESVQPRDGEQIVQVPFLDDQANALTFTSGLLTSLNVPFESLACIVSAGNMMAPGIPKGAEVLATRNIDEIEDGRVYILRLRGIHVVRRLKIGGDGGLGAICDNPAAQSEVADPISQEDVVAKVLWSSHAP